MSGLSFLKNITLASNDAVKPVTVRAKAAVNRNPETADIRIYRNGSVYPSAKLVNTCNLQYAPKDSTDKGNGFDVFSSKDFLNTKHLAEVFLFIAMVPRSEGKIDLFASCTFEEDGTPKSDVLSQGANTAGVEILEKIKEVYGIEMLEGESFMDLKIVSDSPFTTEDSIYFIPKTVSRGAKKGDVTLVRREDLTLYALVPVSMLEAETITEVEFEDAPTEEVQVPAATKAKTAKIVPVEEELDFLLDDDTLEV